MWLCKIFWKIAKQKEKEINSDYIKNTIPKNIVRIKL